MYLRVENIFSSIHFKCSCVYLALFLDSDKECCVDLDEDDHVPDCFDQYDVRATKAQLLVFWEVDFKQISCVLQLLHFCLHCCDCSVGLETFGGTVH